MLHYVDKKNNKKYTFIPRCKWINNIKKNEKIFTNDVYEKHNIKLNNLSGELIECNDLTKTDTFCKKIVFESYQEYLCIISKRDFQKEQWVYNILDGKTEQNDILYQDSKILIVPNYIWNGEDLSKMYLLTFPKNKKLHSIRDLTDEHISLLEHMKTKTLEIIKKKYNFNENKIKIFMHYSPSTYHLHIHFVLISNTEVNSSVEYSHDLDTVINILKIKSDYYQTTDIKKRI